MQMRGFTLLELLLVILITGILAVVVAPIINEPVRAYFAQPARGALVDAAELALRRMEREVRGALPYSLRNGGNRIEFVRVRDVARYRESAGGGMSAAQRLRFNNTDDQFNVIGTFVSVTPPYTLGTDSADERLVIFNLGSAPYDIYGGNAVATPGGTTVTITTDGGEHRVTMNPPHQFEDSAPSHRVYITDTAVSYACSGNGLYRWSNYGYGAQPTAADVATNGALMLDGVTACNFSYHPGSATQSGLLMMELTLTSDDGESITLLHMVHVPNAI